MNLLITIVIFSILIVIHEFGHFIAARRAGVKVEKFSIGFGPAVFKFQGKQTQFLICIVPLGGYVKMAGDSRTEHKGARNEFLSQPVGVKMRIVFFGPLFNYLLAFVLFCVISFIGFPYRDSVVGGVLEGFPAQEAGVEAGDRVLAVNGQPVDNWDEMARLVYGSEGKARLKIQRKGRAFFLDVPLKHKTVIDNFGREKDRTIIGIRESSDVVTVRYGFPQALLKGAQTLFSVTFLIIKGFVLIILGVVPFKEAVAGPIEICRITSGAVQAGVIAVLQITALLNVSLAIINLFPLPVLDGGHIFLFFLEKVRGRPLSEKTDDVLTRIGITLLSLLMIFVIYNDITKRRGVTEQPAEAPGPEKVE